MAHGQQDQAAATLLSISGCTLLRVLQSVGKKSWVFETVL